MTYGIVVVTILIDIVFVVHGGTTYRTQGENPFFLWGPYIPFLSHRQRKMS